MACLDCWTAPISVQRKHYGTPWADHQASRTADKRLTNAWFGKTAALKTKVLDDLLQRV